MKIKNLLISLGLVLSVGAGIGTALAVKDNVKEAKADGTTVYFDTNNTSFESGAAMRVWVSGSPTQNAKYVAYENVSDGLYSFELPSTYTQASICRYNSGNAPSVGTETFWGYGGDCLYNRTEDYSFGSTYNFIKMSYYADRWDYDATRSMMICDQAYLSVITDGTAFYIDVYGASDHWHDDDPNTYLFLTTGSKGKWINAVRVGTTSNIFVATLDEDVYVASLVITRGTAPDFDSGLLTQTKDLNFLSTTYTKRGIRISGNQEGGKYLIDAITDYNDAFIAESYGYQFMHLDICLNDGLSANAATSWATAKSSYNSLKENLLTNKNYIKTIERNISGSTIEQAMARYDNVVYKRGYEDFISRNPATPASRSYFQNTENSESYIITIIAISAVALLAVGGYFFLRKRKEDR